MELAALVAFLHLSEQYFISSHTFPHFFRHVNSRLQTTQFLAGRWDLLPLNAFIKDQQFKDYFVGLN